jgi:hypothetical protein
VEVFASPAQGPTAFLVSEAGTAEAWGRRTTRMHTMTLEAGVEAGMAVQPVPMEVVVVGLGMFHLLSRTPP